MRRLSLVSALVAASSTAFPASAAADAVTLSAPHHVRFGAAISVAGRVSPAAPGEPVQVLGADGAVLASPVTDASGRFSTKLRARRGVVLSARWRAGASAPRTVAVLPRLRLQLHADAIFTPADIVVHVSPGRGVRLRVVGKAHGRQLLARRAWVRGGVVRLAVPA